MRTKIKSVTSRLAMAVLAGGVALGGVAAARANTEDSGNDAARFQALGQAKLTLVDAIRAAEAAGGGQVTGAEFDVADGGSYFDVTTQNGTVETDHRIDPMTGQVIASTPNTEQAGSDNDTGTSEQAELAALQGAKVSLIQAVQEIEKQGGKVLGAEYGGEDKALGIEILAADGTGKVQEFMIDAATGKVMAEQPGADNEQNEGGEEQEG